MEFETVPMPADCLPPEICEQCGAGAIFHRPTRTTAAYCAHTLTGAVLPFGGTWGIVRGIEAHYFRDALVRALMKAGLIGDVAGELEQWLIEQSTRATKH